MTKPCDDKHAEVISSLKDPKQEPLQEKVMMEEANDKANVMNRSDIDEALSHVNEEASEQFQQRLNRDAQAMGVDVSKRIADLKRQEKEKLTGLLIALKEQAALMSTSILTSSGQVDNSEPQLLEGLRLKGALLSPEEGMQKIKAVHQMGLAHLLENMSDTLPFVDDTGEEV
ncbi:hypothetical protein [uncultured Shewanella sp.]|uniref:hypothetical protein n=1 Tax=uncultured Shewanella sp. TaxID=173975 RepID=UPI002637C2AA|nr:hypothetical protein [uncultured Shewanella sp.]